MPSYNDNSYQFTASFCLVLHRLRIYLRDQIPIYVRDINKFVERSTSRTP